MPQCNTERSTHVGLQVGCYLCPPPLLIIPKWVILAECYPKKTECGRLVECLYQMPATNEVVQEAGPADAICAASVIRRKLHKSESNAQLYEPCAEPCVEGAEESEKGLYTPSQGLRRNLVLRGSTSDTVHVTCKYCRCPTSSDCHTTPNDATHP